MTYSRCWGIICVVFAILFIVSLVLEWVTGVPYPEEEHFWMSFLGTQILFFVSKGHDHD